MKRGPVESMGGGVRANQGVAAGKPVHARRPARVAVLRMVAVLGLAVAGVLVAAGSASAHNVLLSTGPADRSTVAVLPDAVTLTFNVPALAIGSVLEVIGPAGNVASGPPSLVDSQVKEAVRPGSPAGAYTVVWRVTSLDGHPISGEFRFTATAGNGGTAPAGSAGTATGGSAGAAAAASPAWTGTDSTSTGNGSAKTIIALLIVAGVLVVVAGIWLARRNPGPTLPPPDHP